MTEPIKGPYSVGKHPYEIVTPDGRQIATVRYCGFTEFDRWSDAEADATARLFVFAPEMLKALQQARQAIDDALFEVRGLNERKLRWAWAAADAAITKATDKQEPTP